jgi:hypothetical protein
MDNANAMWGPMKWDLRVRTGRGTDAAIKVTNNAIKGTGILNEGLIVRIRAREGCLRDRVLLRADDHEGLDEHLERLAGLAVLVLTQ